MIDCVYIPIYNGNEKGDEMKKIFLLLEVALLSLLLSGCNDEGISQSVNRDVVDTTTGSFYGIDENNITVFKGIRYADASQANRWKQATDVYDFTIPELADTFGDICTQKKENEYNTSAMSEDCLYLNVWKPDDANATNLKKVMVYIHGGAYVRGSGSYLVYNGENLVNKNDVIVVTFNYRLGVLGFLAPKDVNTGESGNFGLMDQQMAIKWVYDNIERFGGDKESITIFGNSAGATSVGIHISNDSEATQLVKAGIMQSPYMGLPLKNKNFANKIGNNTRETLQSECDDTTDDHCIYDLNASTVWDVNLTKYALPYFIEHKLASVFLFNPYIDGDIVKEDLLKANVTKPLLIGNTNNDSNFFIIPALDNGSVPRGKTGYYAYLVSVFGFDLMKKIIAIPDYRLDDTNTTYNTAQIENLFTDFTFVCGSRYFAAHSPAKNNLSNPINLYYNNYSSNFNYWATSPETNLSKGCEAPAVCHQAELPYVFHNFYDNYGKELSPDPTTDEEMFSQKIMGLWGDFAKNNLFGDFQTYAIGQDNVVEMNNTSPNLFEKFNFYEDGHHCSLWNDYYDSY